jgi:undecaprenyl-diphosphatase
MALITVRPTRADIAIANAVVAHTGPGAESIAKTLTWAADEHILCALAAAWWLYSRNGPPAQRRTGNHIFLTTLTSTLLPHLLKRAFDQKRPDRLTVRGHWRGVPFSGKPNDAFPSGHALHVGALASAADLLPRRHRTLIRALAVGLSVTRIVLLAHWASDVVAGFGLGVLTERLLRLVTLTDSHRSAPRAEAGTRRR